MTVGTEKHSSARAAFDKLQDAVGGMMGRMSASMVTSANAFVEKAALSDRYEIEAARVAMRRTKSPELMRLAHMMIADHTASTHNLQAALEMNETRGGVIGPPPQLDARHRTMIEHLEAAPDDMFDSTYIDQQVLAHEEALSLLVHFRDQGDNPQLRSCAAAFAPVVYRHLQHCKALKQGH
jgi:putative membrane protein